MRLFLWIAFALFLVVTFIYVITGWRGIDWLYIVDGLFLAFAFIWVAVADMD